MKGDRGFSLVEVVVAMVILSIGVLGLAASSAAVSRLSTEGGRMAGAAAAASSQLEILRAGTCATMASGSGTATGGYALSWTVTTVAQLRQVTMTVSYSQGRKTRSATYQTWISCAPQAS